MRRLRRVINFTELCAIFVCAARRKPTVKFCCAAPQINVSSTVNYNLIYARVRLACETKLVNYLTIPALEATILEQIISIHMCEKFYDWNGS